ncbi:DsbA family oxidoreductase [Streptomyces sp. WMMC500]|uniref:DsbA family oxidoreductase n=1 Tax=Streptomyces sp. WMMC500 TaxID=3015154 RepID=UPI00248AD0C0|nr:DsbA family oxidoreductase [Streptomyces sp. WMMC500]WBB60100.1 DsbA family oxidoreductase [Streptomyces sp. WMMC500]
MRVEIWSDIVCPWCYVGKARFEKGLAAFSGRDDVEVVHRSFELASGAPRDGRKTVAVELQAKYGWDDATLKAMEDRVGAAAAAEGLGMRHDRFVTGTFDHHRLLHLARERGLQDRLLDALFTANFAEARPISEDDTIVDIATGAGLDADEVRKVLADETAYADAVRADEREAAELGAGGVPFFVIDRRFAVSGGQPAEVFTQALEQAAAAGGLQTVATAGGDGAVCADDSCDVP